MAGGGAGSGAAFGAGSGAAFGAASDVNQPLVTLAVGAPVVTPELAFSLAEAHGGAPATFWDAPPPRGTRWAFVGWGEAARAEAQGEGALAEVAAEASQILARVAPRRVRAGEVRAGETREGEGEEALREAPADAPGPRLFGGVAFTPGAQAAAEKAVAPPWEGFADASFVLPAWVYATDGERAVLRVTVGAAEAAEAERALAALVGVFAEASVQERATLVPTAAAVTHEELCAPGVFHELVREALRAFASGAMTKVVLAVPSLLTAEAPFEVGEALGRLGEGYPECARFALPRGKAVFVGASPERLVAVEGRALDVDALAGTMPRRGDDAEAARALLGSNKDRREHALVVDAIAQVLTPLCASLTVPEVPVVRTLRNVHHLWSPVRGVLVEKVSLLALAGRLHPTPAICGTPRPAALGWIRAREPAPRGWYAGAVGWLGEGGDGALWVGLRSALVEGTRAWLYAGVGLVAGSEPEMEFSEVRAKRRPMLAALGGVA
ncbi:isochorismate synthase [Chondromyces apiculatus]|uniref:isochorismate synthase n=1 Tax=Chondromyces apiculatus DSM 436 TaxID=1192034 RepID=A0A017TFJ5_9BACT|nr:isochorismate synthase [Chondromyces apiculatus]EYF07575.1 Isochorismate synthase [Chondromyces apiculatus DSM 436]